MTQIINTQTIIDNAQFIKMKTEIYCYGCSEIINKDEQAIKIPFRNVNDFPINLACHKKCWFITIISLRKWRQNKMSDKEKQATLPTVPTPIGEVPGVSIDWDLTHASLIGKEVTINSIEQVETFYGEAILAQCIINKEEKTVLYGGMVLVEKLNRCKGHFPVMGIVIDKGKYFDFE